MLLQLLQIALALQRHQSLNVALEHVDIAHGGLQGFDVLGQGLHRTRLVLELRAQAFDLLGHPAGGSGHLLGQGLRHFLYRLGRCRQGGGDALLQFVLRFGQLLLLERQLGDLLTHQAQTLQAGVEVNGALAHGHDGGIQLVDLADQANAHGREKSYRNDHQYSR